MLELTNLNVALPGRGTICQHLGFTAEAGQVTALVGPGGSGTSTLLRLLAGVALPGGTLASGAALLGGRDLLRCSPSHRHSLSLYFSPDAEDPRRIGEVLARLQADPTRFPDLASRADTAVSNLPPDLRAQALVATLEAAPHCELVLVDQPGAALDGKWRSRLGRALRARAAAGAHVLWAEHQLDPVWEFADAVAEPGEPTTPLALWEPKTVREPTLKTLGRALGLPPAAARSAKQIAAGRPGPFATRPTERSLRPAGIAVAPADLGLASELRLELTEGECIGVVSLTGRPEPIARKLTARLHGTRVPSLLPSPMTPGSLMRQWGRRHAADPVGKLPNLVRAHAPLATHSSGERAQLRLLMAEAATQALWLPQPQLGLDQAAQLSLQRKLRRSSPGIRIVTSRDVEFLVRACSRLLVVNGDEVAAFGTPQAASRLLPEPPLVAQALPGTPALRLSDVLDAIAQELVA